MVKGRLLAFFFFFLFPFPTPKVLITNSILLHFISIMETLFRKLRESASSLKRSSTSSNSPERSHHHHPLPHHAPLGLFDSLPSDLLLKIIRLLDPKHAAKLCIVCKSWRSLVSDNQLWSDFLQNNQPLHYDSIIFSETKLTSGYPLP